MGKIILYYKYIQIEDPVELIKSQRELCEQLGLKGRVLIAGEGINGTLGGSEKSIELYKKCMLEQDMFSDIDFKESPGDADHFPKLKILLKKEIVNLGLPAEINAKNGGIHLDPQNVHELIESKKTNLVILDTRNDYESRIGYFENALLSNTENFRDFPKFVDDNLEQFKDKEVLMYCTGGVRCERASAYLKTKNIAKEVYQIKGGIHRYIEQFPEGYFRGKNYVFDGRIAVKANDEILANCELCNANYDSYTNCINAECNKQIIVCPTCIESYHNTCSKKCLELVNERSVVVRVIPKKVDSEEISSDIY